MFGIGLPEMILILALALIVVGPDKLPELARSLAKGIMELKKTAEGFKDQIKEEGNLLEDVRPDLEDAAKTFKSHMLDHPEKGATDLFQTDATSSPAHNAAKAYEELTKSGVNPDKPPVDNDPQAIPPFSELTEDVTEEKTASSGQSLENDKNDNDDASRTK